LQALYFAVLTCSVGFCFVVIHMRIKLLTGYPMMMFYSVKTT